MMMQQLALLLLCWLLAPMACCFHLPAPSLSSRRVRGQQEEAHTTGSRQTRRSALLFASTQQRLTFTANVVTASAPIIVPTSSSSNPDKGEVLQFFRSSHFLENCLCATGRVERFDLTPEYHQVWIDACSDYYGDDHLPVAVDCSVLVTQSNIQFPGLTMKNTLVSGIQLMEPSGDNTTALPFYKGILLGGQRSVSGAPPVVWLYHQLTSGGGGGRGAVRNDDGFRLPQTCRATNTISLMLNTEQTETGRRSNYCVQTESQVTVFTDFSQLLVRILPMSVQKMELTGSAAVQKAVTRDIGAAQNRCPAEFLAWQQESQQATTTVTTTIT
jgi:hypothetical protein